MPMKSRLGLLLALSLGLNLFLVGFGTARWLTRERPMRERREAIEALLDERGPELSARREALSRARGAALSALKQEPYSRERAASALADLRAQVGDAHEQLHARLLDRLDDAAPEERRAMAEKLFAKRRGHKHRNARD